ncbi:MAG: helix-turn-helix domain-containing protein [Anaerolineae bacterium]
MQLPIAEVYARLSGATSRLQGEGGEFHRFTEKHRLDRLEFWLATRFRYFPGSATPHDFSTFGPYTSVSKYQTALDTLTEKKLVERAGEGRYRLSDSARKALADTYAEYFARVARLNLLSDDDAESLYGLADRVYTSALRQADVPAPILNAAHSILPEIDSVWVQLERRLVGALIFRDESHIAAWREAGYTGPRVELSTLLFQAEDGLPHDELRAAASRLDDKDFVSALSALHSGGEVTQRDERYKLSKSGRAARQEIEEVTDRNFARPFATLEDDRFEAMIELLDKLSA